ncbi:MAG: hypothetical protein IKI37_01210 [Oscillospiraceae bacterium]|nr:hypothetical protein [Oscillospiraceae bacterium]
MEKINVSLYQNGLDRNAKRYAEVVYCDNFDKCDFYNKQQCLRIYRFGCGCHYGRKEHIDGYTPKARKYSEFYQKYHDDEMYEKLSKPASGTRFAVVGDYLYFDFGFFSFVLLKADENRSGQKISCKSGRTYCIVEKEVFPMTDCLIAKEDVTPAFLNEILKYRFSRLLFGSNADITKQYRHKIIPDLLTQIQDRLPDLYNSLIAEYPEYKQKERTYIGRIAYISTMADGSILETKNGEKYVLHDGFLTGIYHSSYLPFGSKQAEIRIKVTEDMTYQITHNSQVNENTRFL